MRLIDQVNGYAAMERLAKNDMSYEYAYALWQAKEKVKGNVEFFMEKERQLTEKYGVKEDGEVRIDEQGRFRVTDPVAYKTDHGALCETECEDIQITLPQPEKISAEDLAALAAMVKFLTPEESR